MIVSEKRLVTLLWIVLISTAATWAQSNSERPTSWRLKSSKLQLRLLPDKIVIEEAPQKFWTACMSCDELVDPLITPHQIPLASIDAVIQESVERKPVQEAMKERINEMKPENMIDAAKTAPGEAVLGLPAYPVFLATEWTVLSPFRGIKTRVQSVRIFWNERGVPHSNDFILNQKDSESFARSLAEVSGLTVTEVRFGSDIQHQVMNQMLVSFTEPTSVGDVEMWGGTLRFLTLKCTDGTNLIYIFSTEKQMPQDALSALKAMSAPLGDENPWRVKIGRNLDGVACIKEVDTNAERLVVNACQKAIR